jgi:hypothetical protein
LDWWQFSKLCCFAEESKEAQVSSIGMPERRELPFNVTTNLEDGKNKREKVHPHFPHCLVCFLIYFDWFFMSLYSLATNTGSMSLEVPCCVLGDCVHQGV